MKFPISNFQFPKFELKNSFIKILTLFFGVFFVFGSIFFVNINQALACDDDSDCSDDERCVSSGDGVTAGVCEDRETDDSDDDNDDETEDSNGGGGAGISNPISYDTTIELISAILRAAIGLIGVLAVASFVYGGILYMTSGGSDEQSSKAKKVLGYAVMGLIVSILSYVIVSTVINIISGS